jgi:hypothetical protein
MCRSPPVGNFCQLITSFVLRLCIEHTRRIINIVAILELEHEAEINVFVIEGVGDTSVPIRLAVSNSGTVVRSNDTVSIYIFILHHTRFHRLTGMFAYICHSGFQLH